MPSIIRLERVAFAHADHAPILSAVDLSLGDGWTAVVGENGAGKTTLLRLVAGELSPGGGRVRVEPPGARIVLRPQDVDRRGADVDALAARSDGEARRLRGALALDVAGLARWETLSPGERRRWQVASALAAEPGRDAQAPPRARPRPSRLGARPRRAHEPPRPPHRRAARDGTPRVTRARCSS